MLKGAGLSNFFFSFVFFFFFFWQTIRNINSTYNFK